MVRPGLRGDPGAWEPGGSRCGPRRTGRAARRTSLATTRTARPVRLSERREPPVSHAPALIPPAAAAR